MKIVIKNSVTKQLSVTYTIFTPLNRVTTKYDLENKTNINCYHFSKLESLKGNHGDDDNTLLLILFFKDIEQTYKPYHKR